MADEDAVNRTRFDAKSTEHAFRIVNGKPIDPESLSDGALHLVDINTVNRARYSTFLTTNAGRQIETMKASIPSLHRHWRFRILVGFGKRLPSISTGHRPDSHPHAAEYGVDGSENVKKPPDHCDLKCSSKTAMNLADFRDG